MATAAALMPEPGACSITRLDVVKARRLLQDMVDKPFLVLIWDGDRISGVVKGVDPAAAQLLQEVITAIAEPPA